SPLRADRDDRRVGQVPRRHRRCAPDAVGPPPDRQPDEGRHRHPRRRRGPGGGEPHGHRRQPDHLAHVPDRRRDGRSRRRPLRRPVRAHQPVQRLHPRTEGVHRGSARWHREHPGRDGRRDRAGAPRSVRRLLPVAAHGRRLWRRVQGHPRLLDPDPDPDLPAQRPPRRSRARARMIWALLAVALVAASTFAVATFPRSVLVFLLFQGSLLFVYRARIPDRLRWSLLAILGVAATTGILLGLPVLRLHGDYLAIVTLGFGEVIRVLANNLDKPINFTNGPKGITPISRPPAPFGLPYGEYFYFLALLIVVAVVLVNRRLEDSHIGRAWEAIREDELAARAMGVPLVRMKLMAFACGASFAGVMGV